MMEGMPTMQMFEMVDVPDHDKKKPAFSQG